MRSSMLLVLFTLLAAPQDRSRIHAIDAKEPGTRIRINGTIFGSDGKAPAANVRIFLYQTDAAGFYSRPTNNLRRSRIHATLWTDTQGRYSFNTVQPGHYAGMQSPPPMHIHVHLQPPGLPDHWVDSYYFEGDRSLSPEDIAHAKALGRFTNIVRLTRDSAGMLNGSRDFRIDSVLARRNQLEEGWYRQ